MVPTLTARFVAGTLSDRFFKTRERFRGTFPERNSNDMCRLKYPRIFDEIFVVEMLYEHVMTMLSKNVLGTYYKH